MNERNKIVLQRDSDYRASDFDPPFAGVRRRLQTIPGKCARSLRAILN